MIQRIFLDLDDVCNTLTPYILWWLNIVLDPRDYSIYPGNLDIVLAANKLLGRRRYTRASFWRSIPRRVWAETPESPEYRTLLRWCRSLVGPENVYIATSPTKDPDCLAGKLEWIHNHAPRWLHRQYFVTPRKHLLAQSGTLLIDDNETNCQKFQDGGGRAVRMPRPWNVKSCADPLPYLQGKLTGIFGKVLE